MATINSYADVVLDWENILAACRDNPEMMTAAESLRTILERLLTTVRELNARKEAATGLKQQLRQELVAVLQEGREIARRLRGAAKAQLGTRNERLVQFKTRPIRDRKGRRSKSKSPKVPVTPVTPVTAEADGTPAQPSDPKA
jgi:prophage DNA circulation protein